MIFRNFLFYFGLIPITMLFAILSTGFYLFPFKIRYYLITRWSHFFIFWAKITCGLKYQIENQEILENFKKLPVSNAIVFANHQSMWETIFMQVLLPEQAWVLKKELLRIPFFGWGLGMLQPIAINRKDFNSIKELIKQGKKLLEKGRWVIIFPEGTRVAPNVIHRYSRSGAALAEATGYPVVSIAHNAGLYWPRGFWIKKSGTIHLAIGPIIDSKDKSATEINTIAENWIRSKVLELNQQK